MCTAKGVRVVAVRVCGARDNRQLVSGFVGQYFQLMCFVRPYKISSTHLHTLAHTAHTHTKQGRHSLSLTQTLALFDVLNFRRFSDVVAVASILGVPTNRRAQVRVRVRVRVCVCVV